MENQIIDDSFGMALNDQMRAHIREIAKWSYFLSIVGFVFLGFTVIGALFTGMIFGSMMRELGEMGAIGVMSGGIITIVSLAVALLYFFPILYLFRFSSKAKVALRSGSDTDLTEAFANLKSHYKFLGILTIVFLGLYVVFILFGSLWTMML